MDKPIPPWRTGCDHQCSRAVAVGPSIADAISFFRLSCGRWRSQRSSHHLLHRRAEAGGSCIEVVELAAYDGRLQAIAALHGHDPSQLVGGCRVRWSGSMAWDKAGEAHEGESVFGLIPTDGRGRAGLLLRDRGYAETAPVAGRFAMDDQDGLLLTTDYETMSSIERFCFAGPDVRLRTSTVEGLSNTASFCIETRLDGNGDDPSRGAGVAGQGAAGQALSLLGW
jgi:CpeS-like protein